MTQLFKVSRLRLVAAATIASASLVACGGGGSDGFFPPTPTTPATVPASAGVSIAAFVAYIRGLTSTETDEPVLLGSFVAPTDETSEPTAIP